jgi:hypothetical protein
VSTVNEPVQRSLPASVIGVSRHVVEPGCRERIAAASDSCPSRKIVAQTSTASPIERLTGWRPQSIWGQTSSIWIRGGRFFGGVMA